MTICGDTPLKSYKAFGFLYISERRETLTGETHRDRRKEVQPDVRYKAGLSCVTRKVSLMERSTSLLIQGTVQPTPLPRSKSCVQPIFSHPVQFQTSEDRQSTNQKAEIPKEANDTEPSSQTLLSTNSAQPSCPQSLVSPPPLPPPRGVNSGASEKKHMAIYLETLPTTTTPLSNVERSTSLLERKRELAAPVLRTYSDPEPLRRKTASQTLLNTCNRYLRPERPPPPNFNKSHGMQRLPLLRQVSTSDDCDPQEEVSATSPGASERQSEDQQKMVEEVAVQKPSSPSRSSLSSTEPSSPQSPVSPPHIPPPAGPDCSASEEGEIPLYVEILPDKKTNTEVSNLERSTSLVTLEAKPPVPGHHRSKSHSELLFRKPAWLRILRDQQRASQGAKKPSETSSVRQRPERPPPPNFNRSRERHRSPLPRQMSTVDDCDLQDGVGENPPGANDSQDGESETSLKTFEEEDAEKLSSTLLLQRPSPTEPSSSQFPVATPPLPPPAGQLNSASDDGEIPLYVEILPDETADTEVNNLGRSTSLVLPKPVSPVAVQRSKSHSEILRRKPAWLRIPWDPKKANRGAKKPLDTSNQRPRPDRPPPPNLNKSQAGHRPQLPIQVCAVGPSDGSGPQDRVNDSPPDACDSQDGESNTSLKIFEEEDVNKSSSPLPPSPVSPQPSSPHSLESGSDLHPLAESESFVSEQGEVPIYEEIVLDETTTNEIPIYLEVLPGARTAATEVSILHRSTTLFTPKPEPPAPMNRSLSHAERIFRKPAWFRHSRDQQKAKKGAKLQKLSDAGSRRPRPERPPPPNFTKSHTEHRPPLPRRRPTSGSSDDPLAKCEDSKTASHSRSTEVNNETRQFDCDNVYDGKDPRGACDTEYDSKPPPLGCDAQCEDGEPPLGSNDSKFDSKTLPVDCNTMYDSKSPPVVDDTQYKGSDTGPGALDTKYSRKPPPEVSGTKYDGTPPAAVCDTQSKDIKISLYTCDTIYDSISAPATCDTMYDSKPPPIGCDTENNDKPPPVYCDPEKNTNTPPVGCDSEDHSKSPPVDCGSENNSNTPSNGCDSEDNSKLRPVGGDSEDNSEPPPTDCDSEDNSEPPPVGCDSKDNSKLLPDHYDSEDNSRLRPVGCDSENNSKLLPGHYDSEDNGRLLPVGCDSEGNSEPVPPGSDSDNNNKAPLTDPDPEYDGKPPPVGCDAVNDGISLPACCDHQHKKNLKIYEELPGTPSLSGLSLCQMPGPYSTASVPPVPPRVDVAYSLTGQGQDPVEPRMEPRETTAAEARMSKVVHKFFTKRPLPPIPQPGSFEEQGTCSHITHDHSAEPKPEDIELLMAWWHTVEQRENMPLDLDLNEEEEMREFRLMAYRIKMGLRLFSCLLRKNVESLQGHITQLSATADNLDKKRKKAKIAAMTGGTTGAVGGVAVVAGLVLAPVTFGASLVATAVGVGVATAGGLTRASATLTSKVNNNLDRKRVQKIMRDYEKDISDIERCLKFVNMGIGWVGQQNTSRLRVADEETAALVRLAQVTHGNSSSIPTACQSVEILQEFSQAMDDFFDNAEVQKGAEVKFADEIHGLAEQLQQRLNSLMRIHDILTSAASTAGVYKEPHCLP
ncbi:hypothetical protein GJAV_G00222790 [Gymnothorax javanicus]|nr:hypothetical protein GJAV_G00222790 [Gymnothorax javanicus]